MRREPLLQTVQSTVLHVVDVVGVDQPARPVEVPDQVERVERGRCAGLFRVVLGGSVHGLRTMRFISRTVNVFEYVLKKLMSRII